MNSTELTAYSADMITVNRDYIEKMKAAQAHRNPSALMMTRHALTAAGRVVTAAAHREPILADAETVSKRTEICAACPHWQKDARFGLGKCGHRKCGCTRFKLKLATETCPDGKW